MNILVIGINYFPEITSTGLYTTQMCEWFANRGHNVNVITAFPFYPEWKIHKKYKNKLIQKEMINNVEVYRSFVYVPKKINAKKRILHEVSFGASSVINLLRNLKNKPDLVISVCPPFQLGFHGYIISKLLKIPFVYHIQDLQIDAAADLNMIRNKNMLKFLFSIEKFLLRRANIVTTISEGMREKIIEKGIPQDKVKLFPNWSDIEFIKPYERNNEFRKSLGINKDDFLILYAGNMGEKQGLNTVIETANLLKDKKYKFLLVGSGAKKHDLINKANEMNLENVKFLDVQPKELLPKMLSAADICLVPQQKNVTDIVMPSKLTNILASGGIALVSANDNCEVSKVVNKYKFGKVIEPENPQVMSTAIIELCSNKNLRDIYKKNARLYAENNLDMTKILTDFEMKLKTLCSEKGGL